MAHLPVTIISGFVGAGKTTVLNSLLNQCEGMRLAAIVNRLENKDALGLDSSSERTRQEAPARLVEIKGGCICCVRRNKLLSEVGRLSGEGYYNYLIIEALGIAEPLPIADTLVSDASDRAIIDALVTVVDASNFLNDFRSADSLRTRGLADDTDERDVVDVLVNQVEFANVLVLNKFDRISPGERSELEGLLHLLNPEARLVPACNGQVTLEQLVNTHRFDPDEVVRMPGWLRALGDDGLSAKPTRSSFTYTARRPFHPQRFWDLLQRKPWRQVLRSKGFVWLANRPEVAGLWTQAGRVFSLEPAGVWWAAVPEDQRAKPRETLSMTTWHPEFGDRRQEIVFIGRGLDSSGLTAALDACLLTDAEMTGGPVAWRALPDPLPPWNVELYSQDLPLLEPAPH